MSGADLFGHYVTGEQMNAGRYDEDKIELDTSEEEKAEAAAWREEFNKKMAAKNGVDEFTLDEYKVVVRQHDMVEIYDQANDGQMFDIPLETLREIVRRMEE